MPYFNSSSLITPQIVKPSKSLVIQVNKDMTNNGLWCQFCWYYFSVFQAALPTNITAKEYKNTTLYASVTEQTDSGAQVPIMKPNLLPRTNKLLILQGQAMQRKFLIEALDPITLNVTELNNGLISVYLSAY